MRTVGVSVCTSESERGKSSAALLAAARAHAGALGHETNVGSRKGKTKRDSPGKSYSKSPQLTGFQNDLTATS